MRPPLLNPLFAALTSLPGIGPKQEKLYRAAARPRRGAAAHRRSAVASAVRHWSTGARGRSCVTSCPERSSPLRSRSIEHRPPPPRARRGAPYRIYAHDDTGTIILTYFSAYTDHLKRLLPVGAVRYVSGTASLYDGMLQIVHPDRVVDAAGLPNLPLVEPVYPLTEGLGARTGASGHGSGAASGCRTCPNGRTRPGLRARTFPRSSMRCGTCTGRPKPGDLDPASPAWCRLAYDELLAGQLALALVRANMRRPAGSGARRRRASAQEDRRRPALRAHRVAAARDQRHRRRPRQADPHAAAAARRCRLRQDRGGAARRRGRDRGRPAGGLDGADRNSRAPAPADHRPARRGRRPARRHPHRPGARPRARRHAARACRRRDRPPGRHPCAVPGRRRVPRSRAGDRRRAASLRRAPASRARAQGRGRRHAGADRNADPAHAGAHLFRRHGDFRTAREAGRAAADRYPHHPVGPHQRGGGRGRARDCGRQAGLLGLPAGRGVRDDRSCRRRRSLRPAQATVRRQRSIWSTAA